MGRDGLMLLDEVMLSGTYFREFNTDMVQHSPDKSPTSHLFHVSYIFQQRYDMRYYFPKPSRNSSKAANFSSSVSSSIKLSRKVGAAGTEEAVAGGGEGESNISESGI